jgi:hypothetical protein
MTTVVNAIFMKLMCQQCVSSEKHVKVVKSGQNQSRKNDAKSVNLADKNGTNYRPKVVRADSLTL